MERRDNTNNTRFQRVGDTDNIIITRSHKNSATADDTSKEVAEPENITPEQQITDNSVQRVIPTNNLVQNMDN